MRLLLDQDVPVEIARVLRRAGHDVLLLKECLPVDSADEMVLNYAIEDKRVLVTCNRDDFLALAKIGVMPGLIILIRRRSRIRESSKLLRLLENAGESGVTGNINFA